MTNQRLNLLREVIAWTLVIAMFVVVALFLWSWLDINPVIIEMQTQ